MKTDLYTKTVLTVIALALAVIMLTDLGAVGRAAAVGYGEGDRLRQGAGAQFADGRELGAPRTAGRWPGRAGEWGPFFIGLTPYQPVGMIIPIGWYGTT
jgi:hypothetical protein